MRDLPSITVLGAGLRGMQVSPSLCCKVGQLFAAFSRAFWASTPLLLVARAASKTQDYPSGMRTENFPPNILGKGQTVSIIIPIYNERLYVSRILARVRAVTLPPGLKKEIIVVDDGSTDGTTQVLEELNSDRTLTIHHSILNFGKGTAIRIGLRYAAGDFILIQDGDLEYDPNDYGKLLVPLLEGTADVVYGSRFFRKPEGMRWQNYWANKLLTLVANLLYNAKITDEATAYKVFRRDVIEKIDFKCKRFEFCPEVTAKLRRHGFQIREVPITYKGRSLDEGKKIQFRDGLQAIWTLLKYRFVR